MSFNTGGFGGGWGGGNRFTAASYPCPGSFVFSGNPAKAPPFSVSSGMSPSPNMFPGAGFPGKRGIFDHPIVQASGIKAPTPLGHDLPSANLSARSSTFGSAPFRASGESHGRAVSVGRDFNPSPSLRPESNVAAPPKDSHSPVVIAPPVERKVPPPLPDQRATESSATKISSLVGGLRILGECIGEVEPTAECPGGEAAYRAACREVDKKVGEALGEVGKKCADFAEKHPVLTAIGGMAAETLARGEVAGAAKTAYDAVSGAVKAFSEVIKSSGPGGLALATPGGPTIGGALEAAPAVATMGEGAKIGTQAIAASDVSLSFESRRSEGKSRIETSGKAESFDKRKVDTPEMRNSFVKSKESSGEWVRHQVIDDRQTWHNKDKTQYYQKTIEKSEIEVYDKQGRHIGVIKPSDGELRTDLKVEGRSIDIK